MPESSGHGHDDDSHTHGHGHDDAHGHSDYNMSDLNSREWAALLPMLLPSISASNADALSHTKGTQEQRARQPQQPQQTGAAKEIARAR